MENLLLIIVWLAFGFATMKIAQSKGHDKTLWFILGVLFGIFSLIVIALLPAKKQN